MGDGGASENLDPNSVIIKYFYTKQMMTWAFGSLLFNMRVIRRCKCKFCKRLSKKGVEGEDDCYYSITTLFIDQCEGVNYKRLRLFWIERVLRYH